MHKSRRLLTLILVLAFVVLVRLAMAWSWEWSLLLFVPVIAFGIRDVVRWRRRDDRRSVVRALMRCLERLRLQAIFHFKGGLVHRHSAEPIRYCPKCGYPMKPGRCPECGVESARERLRRSPPGRIRRHKWKIAAIVIAGTAYWGGGHVYHHVNWEIARSNETLFDLAKIGNGRALAELESRFESGKLSKPEKTRLFDQSLSTNLETISPYPSDAAALMVRLNVESSLPTVPFHYRYYLRYFDILVDGQSVRRAEVQNRSTSEERFRGRWSLRAPPQKPGRHELTVKAIICLSSGGNDPDTIDFFSECKTQVKASNAIEVVDRPFTEFLEAIHDPQTAEFMEASVHVSVHVLPVFDGLRTTGRQTKVIRVQQGGHPLPLIANVEARIAGDATYQKLGSVWLTRPGYKDFDLETLSPILATAEKLDVRLIPNLQEVFCSSMATGTKYYDVEIHKNNLVVSQPDSWSVYRSDIFSNPALTQGNR
jgi:hypothetical protein